MQPNSNGPASPTLLAMTHCDRFGRRRTGRVAAVAFLAVVATAVLSVGSLAAPVSAAGGSAPAAAHAAAKSAVAVPSFAVPAGAKVVNYYPPDNSWYDMWLDWDPQQYRADMSRAHSIGANTVRLILFPQYFGYPAPTAQMQGRLASAVSIAAAEGLKVQLTLFDHFTAWTDVAGSQAWTQAILAPYAGDPRVAFIEVQNELDPHSDTIVTWLRGEIRLIHRVMPKTPVTVSTDYHSGAAGPALMIRKLRGAGTEEDFADYHYYGYAKDAYQTFKKVKRSVAPRPLLLGEVGISSVGPWFVNSTDGMQTQALWLATVERAAVAAGLPPGAPWTLNDFTRAGQPYHDPNVAQYHYGLFRTDGTPKPAAYVIAQAFGAGASFAKAVPAPDEPSVTAGSTNTNFSALIVREDRPANWSKHLANEATFGLADRVAPGGGNAVTLSHAKGNHQGWPSLFTVPTEVVKAGQVWSLSAYARGLHCTGVNRIGIAWFGSHGRFLGWTASRPLRCGSDRWQRLSASGHPRRGALTAQIHVTSNNDRGKAEFADVSWTVRTT
jgi:hypothetical protein